LWELTALEKTIKKRVLIAIRTRLAGFDTRIREREKRATISTKVKLNLCGGGKNKTLHWPVERLACCLFLGGLGLNEVRSALRWTGSGVSSS